MEIILKEALPEKVPLLLHTAVLIGTATNRGEDFDIYLGLDNDMATKLKILSLHQSDEALQENTSDLERFGKGSYEDWYSKGRTPFALVHRSSGALAAFVWFGPKELGRKSMKHLSPEELKDEYKEVGGDWHTVAFRSYAPFRGTGVMTDFVRTATDVYMKYFPSAKLWTIPVNGNAASIALAEKLGYKIDDSLSNAEKIIMIR
jgi:hypothetical protein